MGQEGYREGDYREYIIEGYREYIVVPFFSQQDTVPFLNATPLWKLSLKAQELCPYKQLAAFCKIYVSVWFALLFIPGFTSKAALTQSGPVSVALGEATTISCTLEEVEFISTAQPSWYQQSTGEAPRLLIYKSRERAGSVPERFSADTYGKTSRLTVAQVQAEDEGDYYCAVWFNNG